jgi:hypothetical protein
MKTWLLLLTVVLMSSPAAAATSVDRTVAASGRTRLEVSNVAGFVEVRGTDAAQIRITGSLGDDVERLDVLPDGDRVQVVVVTKKCSSSCDSAAELRIEMPRGAELRVDTVSASVRTRDIARVRHAQSVSGDLQLRDARGEVEIVTVSGDVQVEGGELTLQAQTVSGDVQVQAERFAGAQVDTVSGDLQLRGLVKSGKVRLASQSGDVTLSLGSGSSAQVRAHTVSGELGPGAESRVGGGEATVEVETVSGDIAVTGV